MAGNREIYAVEVCLVPGGGLHPVDDDEKASSFRPVFSKLALHNDWPDWPVQTAEEQSEAHHRYRAFFQRLLGWLKESMAGNREIYAVEVCLVPGGGLHPVDDDEKASSFRPVFSKLALHNDWPDWPVQTAEEQSEAHHRYRAFFQPIIGELRRSGVTDRVDALALSRVNYICRLASISFAGSPPWPGPVAGQRWSGSWGRQTPG